MTIREAARCKGFPDSFEFTGGIEAQRTQIRNAVPPTLVSYIAREIAANLDVGLANKDNAYIDKCA